MSSRSRARWIVRAVLVVLGLGAGLLVLLVLVFAPVDHAHDRRDRTVLGIASLENALKLHFARTGRYPDTATGFATLIDLGILEKEPVDSWGNPYRYELVDGRPVITSFGSDGQRGGTDDAADLSNRREKVSSR
jgi:general secretion pathway protein G